MAAVRRALGRGKLIVHTRSGAAREVFVDFWADEFSYRPGHKILHFVWASDVDPEHCYPADLSVDEMTEDGIRRAVSEKLLGTIEELFKRLFPNL